jgi:hypothetical protein
MAYKNQPSKVSATQWGKTVTIEVEHSDTDLLELIEMFKALAIGLDYSESSWRSVIKELGLMYEEEDANDLKEKLNEWKEDDNFVADFSPNKSYEYKMSPIDSYVRGLHEEQIDAALREHNKDEESIEEYNIDEYVEGTTEDNYDEGGRPIEKDNYKSKE